jgi:hypothetical protein
LSSKTEKVHIQLKYGDIEQQFDAQPQEAWLLVNKFFGQLIPTFEVAKKLQLQIDIQQLAADLNGIVAFSSEGACLLVPKNKLTDNDAILIWLTAQFVGNKLGMVAAEALSKEELQTKLAKSSKIVSTRLGELVKGEVIAKTSDDKYKIMAFGILQAQKEVLPKIKSKINS